MLDFHNIARANGGTMSSGKQSEGEERNRSPRPHRAHAEFAHHMPEERIQHQAGVGEISPQPSWRQSFINQYQYAQTGVMPMQQMQPANYYQNWQAQYFPPNSTPPYGYAQGYVGPPNAPYPPINPYAPNTGMNWGYNQYPSWHSSYDSSGGSSRSHGSLESLNRSGRSAKSNKSRKSRRGRDKKPPSVPHINSYDAITSLHQIKGRVVKVAQDQDGSRFVQQQLAVADESEMQFVFDEAMAGIKSLWNDVYGNFILQKLLEFGTDEMKEAIGKELESDTVSLATRVYGCRVLQKAFDELSKAQVATLVSTFKGNVLLCLHNHNGNHVIQKCIKIMFTMATEAREKGDTDLCDLCLHSLVPIIDEIVESVEELSKHPYGCRAVQRMLEYSIEPLRTKILDSIIACHNLFEDQYGNYVVQKLLTHGRPSDRDAIFNTITSNNSVIKYSKQKQASNVVEALLRLGGADHCQHIVQDMLNCFCLDQNNETESAVLSLSKDAYGNYVIKTALDVLEEGSPQRDQLYSELIAHLEELESVSFAKQIVLKLKAYQP